MPQLRIRYLGIQDYQDTWNRMREFTDQRGSIADDELWLLEHPPVYTLGLNGDARHLLRDTDIPVVKTDRGGQMTWHGPGQLIAYVLLDLRRGNLGVRALVEHLERAVIGLLKSYAIAAEARKDAPGVYVQGRKIASIGLRVRKGCSYHGVSLNVNADLEPFSIINPCGYPGLQMTSLAEEGLGVRVPEVSVALAMAIMQELDYDVCLS